jgi:hypothetical protein
LRGIAAEPAQQFELPGRLDALGDHLEPQRWRGMTRVAATTVRAYALEVICCTKLRSIFRPWSGSETR